MRLLGLDPGLRHTGWGVIEAAGNRLRHVADGAVHSSDARPLAERLVELHDGLARIIAEFRPDEAAVEETFVNKNPTSTLKLGLARGVALLVPGFVSGAIGALLLLPPVRAVLRPLLLGWMGKRAARAARSGRFSGVVVDTVVGADGSVRRRTHRVGEVIDSEGWEVGEEPRELRPGPITPDDTP